jgi:ubiquinone/menaquinone biosynthesis C-methylase UbiE
MSVTIDPEGKEIAALRQVAKWRGARVLEIGCGDGRLTLRLAQLGARVVALDPNRARVRQARRTLPARFAERVRYHVGSAQRLQHPAAAFDLVVFAWSL